MSTGTVWAIATMTMTKASLALATSTSELKPLGCSSL